MNRSQSKYTACVHSGSVKPDLSEGVADPIYTSTSYGYLDVDRTKYPRYFNTQNQRSVAEKIARLEQGEAGMVFSSGMAAISTILLSFLKSGDHAIFQKDLYGGTINAINNLLKQTGIDVSWASMKEPRELESLITEKTKVVYIETPSNPLLKIIDIEGVAKVCSKHSLTSIIDNTFASPINQNPILYGIDVVLHSGTKYLGGHSDISAGAAVFSGANMERIWRQAVNLGGNLDPRTCYLLDRSIKTLAIRVERQNRNAQILSDWLQNHSKVKAVNYPGLQTHPEYDLAKRQMTGFGGMLSFELDTDLEGADRFVRLLEMTEPVISLGGVETIISSPPRTSHSLLSAQERLESGIRDGLLRVSVGIEDPTDILEDFEQALKRF